MNHVFHQLAKMIIKTKPPSVKLRYAADENRNTDQSEFLITEAGRTVTVTLEDDRYIRWVAEHASPNSAYFKIEETDSQRMAEQLLQILHQPSPR
jgi:hypothetical protein